MDSESNQKSTLISGFPVYGKPGVGKTLVYKTPSKDEIMIVYPPPSALKELLNKPIVQHPVYMVIDDVDLLPGEPTIETDVAVRAVLERARELIRDRLPLLSCSETEGLPKIITNNPELIDEGVRAHIEARFPKKGEQ